MAFPTTGVVDDFNRANQNPIAAPWSGTVIEFSTATNLSVISNQLTRNGSNYNSYLSTQYGPDSEVHCTVATKPSTGRYLGLFARVQQIGTAGWDGYALIWIVGASNDTYSLRRYTNGANAATLAAPTSATLTAGQKIGLEVVGNTIRAYKTVSGVWQQVGTDQTDSTYTTAGHIGIEIDEGVVDDFGAGTVVTGGGTDDGFVRVGGAWVPTDRQARVSGAWV